LDKTSPDELRRMLREAEDTLINLNRELELRVDEKTRELRRSEIMYSTLIDSMVDVICTYSCEGIVTFISPGVSDWGYTPEDIIGHHIAEFIHPEDLQSAMNDLRRTVSTGQEFPSEFRILTRDGSDIHIEETGKVQLDSGNVVGVTSVLRDVNKRKDVEQELERNRERLEELVAARTEELNANTEKLVIEVSERKAAEERISHLNQVLRAVRNVNHLITVERSREALLQGICNNLVETRGYQDVIIFLIDIAGAYETYAYGGFGFRTSRFSDEFEKARTSPCMAKSLDTRKVWVSDPERSLCIHCPMANQNEEDRYIMGVGLVHEDRLYGSLIVTRIGTVVPDREEETLFGELADDIGFALSNLEQEDKRRQAEEELIQSENRYRALFENSGAAILFMEEHTFIDCNRKTLEMFRCQRDDIIGKPLCKFAPEYQQDGQSSTDKAQEMIHSAIKGKPQFFQWTATRIDGSDFLAEVSLNAVEIRGRNYIQAMIMDITARGLAELALMKSEEKYRSLSENVPVALFRSNPAGDGVFISANPTMARMFGYDSVDDLINRPSSEIFLEKGHREELLRTICEEGYISDYVMRLRRRDGSEFWASIFARPFIPDDDPDTEMMIDGIISDITDRVSAGEELRSSYEKLRTTIDGTVCAMGLLVDMKDPYTSGHQRDVARLAGAIAGEMSLEGNVVDAIKVAGVLHDLGKLSIPSEILSKPGPMNELEMTLMKTHPRAGYDILKTIDFPWPVADIVLQHHERLDGSGYPQGLSGDEISVEARILAVADVIEAISSHRPYRASRGIEVALDHIETETGRLYDSEVVRHCLTLFRDREFRLTEDGHKTREQAELFF
jgi:PAS domain S-box-containing protein/putative nucleotidyltransferase with HDIG domain